MIPIKSRHTKMKDREAVHVFRQKCRENSLKITVQRVAIYKKLTRSRTHPSAERVHRLVRRQFPNISIDTVNRTLLTFAEIGVLDVTEGYGNPRRFDPCLEAHHHLHCIRCGEIIDFHCREYDRLEIPSEISKGFQVLGKKVVIKGICKKCGTKTGKVSQNSLGRSPK